ncbi:MAG: AAA family ATPase [Bacteroidales bacterium]|nr:AAA family ATPase [Bacteroidales bacterium]MCF8343299.1 AAA family ATPase [Bacteroidales bacterium]MCF8349871.1 AAA family ATPase [Bacteroidales bacterium]MCF8375533.1 AAA family ATPase [Bacteroidales bacterium]MCF8399932.1 AAA family ATPase [Bacteroidales bacterium]
MDIKTRITSSILKQFDYAPTAGQQKLIGLLTDFLKHESNEICFLLKGYAGTGKTSLVSALVRTLPELRLRSVLLAPTGRAAKVLSGYSGKQAYTMHKKMYILQTNSDGVVSLRLQENMHRNTIFIVDEASMIPDNNTQGQSFFSERNLLNDLVEYVYSGDNCRLILIGDTAQLPPVGISISPALDIKYLKASYGFILFSYELDEVVRQSLDSGILANATRLREKIALQETNLPVFQTRQYRDFIRINGNDLLEELQTTFSGSGHEDTVVISRSNKRANLFNREIRNRVLFREEEISAGDMMMVVRNNYYWLPEKSNAGFIANGDIIEILRLTNTQELYGFRFADVTVRMVDYPEEKDMEVKILLDTIMTETPSLPYKDYTRLFEEIEKDYEDIPDRHGRMEKIKKNPYFNALQVKFSYALTCHKTQGGQWPKVFIDPGYLKTDAIDTEYFRWLYTALTRATKKAYLINFPESFFMEA